MAKQRKDKSLSYVHGLAPTKERKRQNGGIIAEPIHEPNGRQIYVRRHRALFECVLDAYLWHGPLTQAQYDAGIKFGREYCAYVYKTKVYDTSGGCHGDLEMASLSAINSSVILRSAFTVLSLAQRDILIWVCADNKRAGGQRRIKLLCGALTVLVKHWKML